MLGKEMLEMAQVRCWHRDLKPDLPDYKVLLLYWTKIGLWWTEMWDDTRDWEKGCVWVGKFRLDGNMEFHGNHHRTLLSLVCAVTKACSTTAQEDLVTWPRNRPCWHSDMWCSSEELLSMEVQTVVLVPVWQGSVGGLEPFWRIPQSTHGTLGDCLHLSSSLRKNEERQPLEFWKKC